MKINVVLVDDHSMILEGLSSMLSKDPDFCVIAKLSNQKEISSFINQFEQFKNPSKDEFTIAIVDLSFNDESSIEFCESEQNENEPFGFFVVKEFSKLSIKSVIYSMHSNSEYIRLALSPKVGAKGYVLKDSKNSNIVNAVKTAAGGGIYIQNELYPFLAAKNDSKAEHFLTGKEKQIARYIAKDFSNEQIAEMLKISKRTVQNHISHIYEKLGCNNRYECIAIFKENL